MADAFQSYINMVTGVTKTTQEKASATARALLKQAGLEDVAAEASERAAKLAEEIMNASRTNRELMQHYVTAEVDKAAARLGFARADEVASLRDEVASLRAQLDEARAANEARMYEARAAAEETAPAKRTQRRRRSEKDRSAEGVSEKGRSKEGAGKEGTGEESSSSDLDQEGGSDQVRRSKAAA